MAKSKKSKKQEVSEEVSQPIEPVGEVVLAEPKKLKECEWCFQFDGDEPQVFAWTDDELNSDEDPKVIFTVTNSENSFISFNKNDKLFKIFVRELSEEGKALRQKQRDSLKDLENGSEDKEA